MKTYFSKTIVWTIAAAISCLSILSCDSTSEQKNEQKAKPDNPTVTTNTQSELLQTILGKHEGLFRGFNIGDPLSKLKLDETFEIFEDSMTHIGFSHETENFEVIDVVYYLDANKTLNSIGVDVFLNDQNAVNNLKNQLGAYLSGKYEEENKDAKTVSWIGQNGVTIRLQDVTKGKDYGIRLSLGNKGSKALSI
jgi:hypothetical protein